MSYELVPVADRYPVETDIKASDDGTMQDNVNTLAKAVVGNKIVAAGYQKGVMAILLDNDTVVELHDSSDCCAYTDLETFLLNVDKIDHMIMGVGTTDEYETWHIFADFGDVMQLKVGWSSGNPFYYGYGFNIRIKNAK